MKSDSKKQKKSKISKKKRVRINCVNLEVLFGFLLFLLSGGVLKIVRVRACVCASDGRVKGAAR